MLVTSSRWTVVQKTWTNEVTYHHWLRWNKWETDMIIQYSAVTLKMQEMSVMMTILKLALVELEVYSPVLQKDEKIWRSTRRRWHACSNNKQQDQPIFQQGDLGKNKTTDKLLNTNMHKYLSDRNQKNCKWTWNKYVVVYSTSSRSAQPPCAY